MSGDELTRFRREIDEIDRTWVLTLARRFEITEAVGNLKQREGLPAGDPLRESRQVEALRDLAGKNGLDPDLVEQLFRMITDRVRARHRELGAG